MMICLSIRNSIRSVFYSRPISQYVCFDEG